MSQLNIEKFIELINAYKPSFIEPKEIKIIFGISDYFTRIQKFDTEIKAYELFGSVAFLLNNRCDFISSESRIWNILLGFNNAKTKQFLWRIKSSYPNGKKTRINFIKLIQYLYFEKGLLLLNREKKENKCFEYFKNKNVVDVLFVGTSYKYKSLSKYFPLARMGVINHPSNKAGSNHIFNSLKSDLINHVTYYHRKYPITRFENFIIII